MSELFSSIHVNILLRLLCAILLGGIIGLERRSHGRPAGLRTHILVCMGAAMIMISVELFGRNVNDSAMMQWNRIETGRVIAGIVTGIGFLGAGAIIRMGDMVRGLTTAASIWFTAVLGIVIGGGLFIIAFTATASALIVLSCFDQLERRITTTIYRKVTLKVDQNIYEKTENQARKIFKDNGIRIQDQTFVWNREKKEVEIGFQIRLKHVGLSGPVVSVLVGLGGVKVVRWE